MENPPAVLTEAETIARDFKEFAYIVSHDLSSPMRAMVEFSRLLKAEHPEALNDEGREYLSLIIESGEKVQGMLLGLLEYSRLTRTAKPTAGVDCKGLLSHCELVLKEKIEASGATLEIGFLPRVTADSAQLSQVFRILLNNALTYHAAGKAPHIRVSAEKNETGIVFTVRDNGIGVEADFAQQIFLPFRRLHTQSEYPGTGMGLALAQKIVEAHGGKIWVESIVGEGATFFFTLPHKEMP